MVAINIKTLQFLSLKILQNIHYRVNDKRREKKLLESCKHGSLQLQISDGKLHVFTSTETRHQPTTSFCWFPATGNWTRKSCKFKSLKITNSLQTTRAMWSELLTHQQSRRLHMWDCEWVHLSLITSSLHYLCMHILWEIEQEMKWKYLYCSRAWNYLLRSRVEKSLLKSLKHWSEHL